MKTYLDEVQSVLLEKEYKAHSCSLGMLLQQLQKNRQLATNKVRAYKWFGFTLLLFIPIISAVLTVLVTDKGEQLPWVSGNTTVVLSFILTILTVFNSVLKPGERFSEACRVGIGIDRLAADFVAGLEKSPAIDDAALAELINKTRKELERYQYEMISMFMPSEANNKQLDDGGKGKDGHTG